MPFQSEKQRRYLWANEPEIARDWTDTYGSRIKKDDGGITNPRLLPHTGSDLLVRNTASGERPKYQKPSGAAHHEGMPDISGDSTGKSGQGQETGRERAIRTAATTKTSIDPNRDDRPIITQKEQKRQVKERKKEAKKKASATRHIKYQQDLKLNSLISQLRRKGFKQFKKGTTTIQDIQNFMDRGMVSDMDMEPTLTARWQDLKDKKGDPLYDAETIKNWESTGYVPSYPGTTGSPMLDTVSGFMGTPDLTQNQIQSYLDTISDIGASGDMSFQERMKTFEPNRYAQQQGNITWNPVQGKFERIPGEGGIDPHVFRNTGLTQGGGGGGGASTAATTTTPSAFQQSLTTSATSPFDYYVGQNPTAKNLAWGQQFNVDPRTMYRTSWAADGGRIPAAFGGIMDTETGRRAYGFGSFFKKIGRAAKKVLKSPIGKAALIGGAGWLLGGGGIGSWGGFPGITGAGKGFSMENLRNRWGIKNLLTKKGEGKAWDWGKVGIGAASMLPFFMGGKEEDDDPKFDYDAAKNAYAQEMMRIKSGAMAGTLDPTKFRYLGVKDGGRAGYYAGGQSTPSDYTMEDAMMTTTQDKLGGITDVMKQADLSRQGSVGQFYAAHGGSPNNDKLMARVKELQDEGLDFNSAMAQAMKELSSDKAEGGRIGLNKGSKSWRDRLASWTGGRDILTAEAGLEGWELLNNLLQSGGLYAGGGRIGYAGGSGKPPITTGQIPQAPGRTPPPAQRPNPMPAPQPNRMRGMNPPINPMMNSAMMNRPMMNPMGGGMNPMMRGMPRRTAQEGGLMDLGGMEKDYRQEGGFVPLGGKEKADDVPARLSKNEFVFTADAVRGAGDGDIDKGAEIMENIMKNLEQGGQISEETQGLAGAQEMFGVSERLSEVI